MAKAKGKMDKTEAIYTVTFRQAREDKTYSVEFRADADLKNAVVRKLAVQKMGEQGESWYTDEVETIDWVFVAKAFGVGELEAGEYTGYAEANAVHGFEIDPTLLIGECECGYHFGIDFTFVDQVDDFTFPCPKCKKIIDTAQVFPE
jgi:hypothetical protein